MKKQLLIIFFLFIAGNIYALNIYEYSSLTTSFTLSKTLSFDKTGSYLEVKSLSFMSADESKIQDINELLVDSRGVVFYPVYETDKYGNRYAVFELSGVIDTEYTFIGKYNIKTIANPFIEEQQLNNNVYYSDDFTKETKLIKPFTPNAVGLSKQVKKDDFYATLLALNEWITENITYEIRPDFLSGIVYDSEQMFVKKKGYCVEYSNIAAAALRSLGIPTRIVVGIVNTTETWGMHAWLEVMDPEGNWVGFDPTYHEIGFLDATHIKQAIYFDYSEVEDTYIKADFGLDNYKFNWLYTPLDLNVDVLASEKFSGLTEIRAPKSLNSGADFNITILNKTGKQMIVPLSLVMYKDFTPDNIDMTAALDKELVFDFNSPDVNTNMHYTYSIVYLDQNYSGEIDVKSKGSGIIVKSIVPKVSDNTLTANIEIYSDKTLQIFIDANVNGKIETQSFTLQPGGNNIHYITNVLNSQKVLLTIFYDDAVIHQTNIYVNVQNPIYGDSDSMLIYTLIIAGAILLVFIFFIVKSVFKK